jgi:hypothetical protein
MRRSKSGKLYWIFTRALGCVVSLFLVALGLEVFQRGCEMVFVYWRIDKIHAERMSSQNVPKIPSEPGVKASVGGGTPVTAYRERPGTMEHGIREDNGVGKEPWEMPAGLGVSAEERRKRHAFFDGLSEEDRNFAALIGCEIVIPVDEGGEVKKVYGGGHLFRLVQDSLLPRVREQVQASRRRGAEAVGRFSVKVPFQDSVIEIEPEPWPETSVETPRNPKYLFMPVEPIWRRYFELWPNIWARIRNSGRCST